MQKKDHDVYDVGDPFEYWCKQAYKFSGKLKISPDFIMEAIEIVKGVCGRSGMVSIFGWRQVNG